MEINLKEIKIENFEGLLYLIPENTVSIELYGKESLPLALIVYIRHEFFEPGLPSPVPLPEGEYTIIGRLKDLNEDQLGIILPESSPESRYEHLIDILEKEGCYIQNPYPALAGGFDPAVGFKYHEAEKNTGDWLVIHKLK